MGRAATATDCSSSFYALPTVVSNSIPGKWALIASTSAKAFCVRKGHATVGARRERTLAALGTGRRTIDLATNKTCTDKKCVALMGVECVAKGAKPCRTDAAGNVGRSNVGKNNFGTGNIGDGNIGIDNVGFRCVGHSNRGVSLVGYSMNGALKLASSFYGGPQSSVVNGKAPSPALPLPPKPQTPPPPSRSPCPPCAKISGGNPPPPYKIPPTRIDPGMPPSNRPPPPAPRPPPPAPPPPTQRPPPPKQLARPPLPIKCTDPCFTWDAESQSCSTTVCADPCTDCVSDGVSSYFCVETYGLKIHETAEECRIAPFCDPSEQCYTCSKGGYGCIQY